MSARPPPVPPEQRTNKDSGAPADQKQTHPKEGYNPRDRNPAEQGRQGTVTQNTTNKGYQQDR